MFQLNSEMEESSSPTTLALNVTCGDKTATFYGWKYNHLWLLKEKKLVNSLHVVCTQPKDIVECS